MLENVGALLHEGITVAEPDGLAVGDSVGAAVVLGLPVAEADADAEAEADGVTSCKFLAAVVPRSTSARNRYILLMIIQNRIKRTSILTNNGGNFYLGAQVS